MRVLSFLFLVATVMLFSDPAFACWSGVSVRGDRVTFHAHDAESHMGEASSIGVGEAVRWVQHLDQVLPSTVQLWVDGDVRVVADGEQSQFGWTSFRALADALSKRLRIPRIENPARASLFTVQLAAGTNRDAALVMAANASCHAHSDVEEGVFPGCNQPGRVEESRGVFRVWYGTYLSRESAARAAAKLAERIGGRPYVRRM